MKQAVNKGFTLVEVLLYMGIASMVLLIIATVFTEIVSVRARGGVIAEVDQQGIQIVQEITQALRDARSVTLPTAGLTSNQLLLEMPVGSVDPTEFALNGTVLEIIENNGVPVALSSNRVNVTSFIVRNLSRPNTEGVVRVEVTLEYAGDDPIFEETYTKTFYATAALREN